MPFYEYECQACKFYTEVMQKITDKPLTKCPSCGKKALKKLVSAPVFRLKGAGWYETDFKSDNENKRNLAGAEKEEAKPEPKAEAKAEAKAEGKSEAKEVKPESKDAKESKPTEAKGEPARRTRRRARIRVASRTQPKRAKTRRKARR
jgi:putative FmdB family regulatory protein